ncbi:hypothetical protein [Microbulbifer spongiae]|uniref:DUF4386 family protein n=1 Tax=Microbulbifer spongiae TaxID=2944933 RepID=A0ABY9EHP1_9GAMM|nr:hypothetical protein [Microbulbifer sp. MI-G]WKD51721.1 hypothetical protein M8T91_18590 [Microbulbifer sp. MI-G]
MDLRLYLIKFYSIHVIVVIITLACFLMNGPMRGGLPLDNTVAERIAFIADNGLIWSLSWFTWMLSAIGLFVFCAILADELTQNFLRMIGIALVGMGIAPDLIAEVIYAFVIPEIISRQLGSNAIEILEIIAMHLTGYLGNGLYNLGGLLLTILAINQGVLKSWIAAWGVIAWILGLMLSLFVAMGSVKAAEIFTAIAMVLSTAWMLIFAHKVLKR